ncbi:MAG TPA: glycosyltransferase family A protein [Flavobacterium sp.]|jgi:glycosyltransferase involved in cell wall biosynthesis
MQPLVSIIIPTFNRAYLIAETLNSVLSQTYQSWECIVVDDGSTDNTEEVVARYTFADTRFKFAKRPRSKPKGANACRNYGFEISNGTLINWLDSDDLLLPEHLMIHSERHAEHQCDAVITKAKVFQESKQNVIRDWSNTVSTGHLITEMIWNTVLWQTNCVVWNREAVPENPFEEDLSSSQEWTFHLKQLINNRTFVTASAYTCLIREHDVRTGKMVSVKKSFSTFHSRRTIMRLLQEKQMLSVENELGLLKYISYALRQSLQFGYTELTKEILGFLGRSVGRSKNRKFILKILFVAFPVYQLTSKGEKLFKI